MRDLMQHLKKGAKNGPTRDVLLFSLSKTNTKNIPLKIFIFPSFKYVIIPLLNVTVTAYNIQLVPELLALVLYTPLRVLNW